jgi:RNA polymerase sigma-70 factor (ECF subfamily)
MQGDSREENREAAGASLKAGNPLTVNGLSVSETIRLAQEGDAAAFEQLYEAHSGRVYALCLRMLRDPADAEDSMQEAFLQMFRKIRTFRGESNFSTWLHRVAVNVVLMKLRRKKPAEVSIEESVEEDENCSAPHVKLSEPDLRLAGTIDRINLQRAIDRLSPGFKSIFLLHDVQGYKHEEIGKILGCSSGNSKSQLHKARMRLRTLLRRGAKKSFQKNGTRESEQGVAREDYSRESAGV